MRNRLPFYQLRLKILARMIGSSVPFLNFFRKPKHWPITLEEMSNLAQGTLGAETALFLQKRNFDLLPQYEDHDMIHTLLGYNTTTSGELRLQAFMWGNGSSSFEGRVLFIIGLVVFPEMWEMLLEDYRRGKRAVFKIGKWDFVGLIERDITLLRQTLEPERTA